MKRRPGFYWKKMNSSRASWKVQFGKGIMSFKTKKEALKFSKVFYPEYWEND